MIEMKLEGATYAEIAKIAGISRQRIQQLISPPKAIREYVVNKCGGKCVACGILTGRSGHIHHEGGNGDGDYNDIDNLLLLCPSCHRMRHYGFKLEDIAKGHINRSDYGVKELRSQLGLTQKEFAGRLGLDATSISRWERGKQRPKAVHMRRMARLNKKGGK